MMNYLAFALVGAALAETVIAWQLVRLARRHSEVGDRLGRFADALALLTETTEAGFRAVAVELGRNADTGGVRPTRPTNGKVARLARRGRSIQEIAADEQLSEGEVRLRIRLADMTPARSRSGVAKENEHGTMRTE